MTKTQDSAKSTIKMISQAIAELAYRIDASFEKAVEMIYNAEKVIVSGIGKSGIIGMKMAATLTSVGKPAVCLHPVEALHGDIGLVGEKDVVVCFSKSGNTKEMVSLFPFIKARGPKIISILGSDNGWMKRESDLWLDASVSKEVCPVDLAPTTSTTAALVIADALSVAYMEKAGVTETDFAKNHPDGQIGRNVTLQVRDVMHKGYAIPKIRAHQTFREAVIEITSKDLGCVCVISESDRLEGIVTDGDIRRILQDDVDVKGMKVKDFMTPTPIAVEPNTFLGQALGIMENRPRQISVLPVTDKDKLVGVIRIHDILLQKS
ncbi:MAG: arabinose-5-phosphate isomerase KdsD [Candidatus Kapaibacteriales bacterium]